MIGRTLKATLVFATAMSLLLLTSDMASAASSAPISDAALFPAQGVGLDDDTFLTIVYATFGSLVGGAILISLGYLLRRRLGIDLHASTGQGVHNGHGLPEAPGHIEHPVTEEITHEEGAAP